MPKGEASLGLKLSGGCRSHIHLLVGLGEAVGDSLPVDDVPDGVEVVGTDVLVLEVVGVLPDINSQKGDQSGSGLEGILVGGGGDLKTLELLVVAQPTPSGTLNSGSLGVELGDELVKRAPGLLDLLEELARGLGDLLVSGGQVLPEECVVDVA